MATFDASALAVRDAGGAARHWTWKQLGWIPWTVPRGREPGREGALTGRLAREAGQVILDLEPYRGFWQGTEADARRFLAAYSAETSAPIQICLDHRRLQDGFPYPVFSEAAVAFLPQVYWTDFRRTWREVLEEAESALGGYERPIEYVLPGNADPADFEAALAWCAERGARASVWVWQTIRAENWPR